MTSAGKDIEKLEPSCIASRNIKYCRHYGKQFASSSIYKTQNYCMTQQFHSQVCAQKK